ncbi:putative baseplate assembly protein [Umezawaea sp. Da 62-37]|uniref:putative baseplate assembly protein n=1 Tax=Umezawaea sp. Da 62-37 TaxID=3075927 RepID=UPI0028F71A02|nr:putative baseplate assembly protein [Umezawaea sp. Da 62-37]WNV87976.1 putative baseplate assembly protein [Umezawaea sp. Da 62-37]
MTLPVPNLDDRRFQDLVDDAKRLVMRRCPEWTDHNVSDPGVTLIETFAFMTDQLLYRLNRVPDRLYVKFLELIGLSLLPPVPARAPVTFWTSAPVAVPLVVEAGTQIGTARTETEEPVLFCTSDRLVVVPCKLDGLLTGRSDGPLEEWFERFRQGTAFDCFGVEPRPGDVLLIGLDEAAPRCAVQIEVDCHVEGIGVDPDNPPLVWEAWTGEDWRECELSLDETGGLNRPGVVILHVPDGHEVSVLEGERAAWLRARVVEPGQGSTGYSASPNIRGLGVCTVGGTVQAVHADVVEGEVLGESEGSAGQRFTAERSPVMEPLDPPMVQVSSEEGWEDWQRVEHFAASGPEDPHYVLDAVNGVVQFGPAVRNPDGTLRHHGAVPEQGATIRIRQYLTGGGAGGNVGQGAICMLRSTLPHVTRVENRRPAQGGVDGESLDEAKLRGPITLRTRSRAVTAEDHEVITRQAAPEIARVRCLPVSTPGGSEVVKVLVVPAANQAGGRIRFEDLLPHEDTLRKIAERLDEVRMVGSRVLIEPPLYRGVTVVARVVARRGARADRVDDEALAALHAFLNPLTGGPDGRGWPFGRAVHEGEVYSVLQRVRGVEMVEQVRLFGANPLTGERGQATGRIELDPTSLVFSYEHQVRVEQN